MMSHSSVQRRLIRCATVASIAVGAMFAGASSASAHPLGNFTTNTALQITVLPKEVRTSYIVDLAEIPALRIRQSLNATTGQVPETAAKQWSKTECAQLADGITLTIDNRVDQLRVASSSASFLPGQAGLTTARLICQFDTIGLQTGATNISAKDTNFADRLGWRETTAAADGGATIDSSLPAVSPSMQLTRYPTNGASVGSNVRGGEIRIITGVVSKPTASNSASSNGANSNGAGTADSTQLQRLSRGNNGITQRFQNLVARDNLSPLFTIGALLLATILGGFHAMAPGHGKSLMAAYVLSRRGGRRELLTIGGTVALTHTIGVLLLGGLFLAGNSVSAGKTLQWTEIASGLLVVAVGVGLLRDRLRAYRMNSSSPMLASLGAVVGNSLTDSRSDQPPAAHPHNGDEHPHPHAAHEDHAHPHPHDSHPHAAHDDHGTHPHPHAAHPHAAHAHDDHPHPHPHGPSHGKTSGWRRIRESVRTRRPLAQLDQARLDPSLVVTSHSHGGLQHTHVLPAPGALVSRRQLLSMGLAGGLVPSPSALVVLLGAVALGRAWFGILLVIAYGIGLALTLMGAGMLLAFFEARLRNWSSTSRRGALVIGPAVAILPVVSAFLLVGGGSLLVARALAA